MRSFYILFLLVFLALGSCRKKPDPVVVLPVNPTDTSLGRISFTFQNVAGSQPLVLDTSTWYVTDFGDSLQVSDYRYYISNIVLYTEDGQYAEPESYYLIDQSKQDSRFFVIDSIPKGTYNRISFMIGVDPRRNTSGAQTGALDPMHGMFWDWVSGYIMSRLEGRSPQSQNFNNLLAYHIGGFSGENAAVRIVNLDLPVPVTLTAAKTPNIHLKADVLEWFKTPETIRISELSMVMAAGSNAVKLATNYADMFTVDHVD